MDSAHSHLGSSSVLARLRGLVARLVPSGPSRQDVGTDGLTDKERAEHAARFWDVANTPPPEETRLRVKHETQAGVRPVVHLKHSL